MKINYAFELRKTNPIKPKLARHSVWRVYPPQADLSAVALAKADSKGILAQGRQAKSGRD